jgi:hypothetical protein
LVGGLFIGFKTFSFLIFKKKKSKKRPMGTPPCMQACRGGVPKGSPKRGAFVSGAKTEAVPVPVGSPAA